MRMYDDISPRWKQQAKRSTHPLTILSPYITQDVALNLLKGKTGARIYTLFEATVFAAGGSSLNDIVGLMKDHEVYRLDGLHAKMVTDHTSFVTIGSQNLTEGGKHNHELSVHLKDEPARRQALEIAEPWLEDAVRITPEMITDMENGLEQLKKLHDEFLAQCAKHQNDVDSKAKRRASRERHAAHVKSRAAIGAKLSKALRTSITKTAQVRRKDRFSTPFLKTDDKASLLLWERSNGELEADLDKGDRYLCFLQSNDFGWARVADQQITRIGRGITYGPGAIKAFPKLSLEVSSHPRNLIGQPDGTNLVVKLWLGKKHVCTVPASFMLDKVTALGTRRPKPASPKSKGRPDPVQPAAPELTNQVISWIDANKAAFERNVRKHVTESFNYSEGNKLAGVSAASFFGATGSRFNVRLAKVRNNPILHVSPVTG